MPRKRTSHSKRSLSERGAVVVLSTENCALWFLKESNGWGNYYFYCNGGFPKSGLRLSHNGDRFAQNQDMQILKSKLPQDYAEIYNHFCKEAAA